MNEDMTPPSGAEAQGVPPPKKKKESNWFTAMWSSNKKGKKVPWSAIFASVLAHVAIIGGAGYLTILVVAARPKVMFEAKQPPGLPARKLEHSIRVKQMQEQMRKPQIMQRLVADAPSAVSLPEMPRMEMPDQKNLRDTPVLNARVGSILGSLGSSGGGAGRGLTGGGGYSDTKFFGENVRTRAVIVLLDTSQTVINLGVLDDLVREATTMLNGLAPVTKFNMIGYVDGAAPMFKTMVFATEARKKEALARLKTRTAMKGQESTEWSKDGFVPNYVGNLAGYSGSTPWKALEMAVEMGADTIFLITDDDVPNVKEGDARTGRQIEGHDRDVLKYVKSIETKFGRPVKVNVVMTTPRKTARGQESLQFYRDLSKASGGKLTIFEPSKKGRK